MNAWLTNTGIPLLITIPRIRFLTFAKSQDVFADLIHKTVILYSIHSVWWGVWRELHFRHYTNWAMNTAYVGTFGNLFMDKLPDT